MKTKRTEIILQVMNIIAWLAVAGFMIKAGAIITSYTVSIYNPAASENMYLKLNLSSLMQYDFWEYTGIVITMIALELIKAYTAFLVTKVLSQIKIASPFTIEVSRLLEKICYLILLVWVAAAFYNGHLSWLSKQVPGLEKNLIPDDFILLAGLVFLFSQIFKRGVEIQTENELTV